MVSCKCVSEEGRVRKDERFGQAWLGWGKERIKTGKGGQVWLGIEGRKDLSILQCIFVTCKPAVK